MPKPAAADRNPVRRYASAVTNKEHDMGSLIFWGAVGVQLIYAVFIYNSLVNIKHNVAQAWANIDVLLKQRHDELPKLVETCRQYMQYEQETLEKVMQARNQVASATAAHDLAALGSAEGGLRDILGRLFAVAEAYPDLKANESFQHLRARISGLENTIADRRELYNASVNINNVRIEQFPDLLVARLFGFGAQKLLEFAAADKQDVDVKQLFAGQ
jgi:LemA protein